MADISIRNLDDEAKRKLRIRAAQNGRSMEAEARAILESAVGDEAKGEGLFAALRSRFAAIGGVELEIPERDQRTRSAQFEP